MILIVNLMPDKEETENNFREIFKGINLDFLRMETHNLKNCTLDKLKNYLTCKEIKEKKYRGAIITGAPLEYIEFPRVDYWAELKEVMDYLEKEVKSTIYICWAAQAALYHFYNIDKHLLEEKLFGVYNHEIIKENLFLEESFMAPHSRNSYNKVEDIKGIPALEIIATSKETGPYMIAEKTGKKILITGHGEYQKERLEKEYLRDFSLDENTEKPKNYYDSEENIVFSWKEHRKNFYSNWIKYIEDKKN